MTPALTITMTAAGLARFTAAQVGDPVDLTVSSIGLTDADFVIAPTLTALPGEFRRIATISGKVVGDNTVHLVLRDDDDTAAYGARGFGLFLADGTLFAVYGQSERLFTKSLQSSLMAAIDLAFPSAAIDNIAFGDTSFLNPAATTTTAGVVELATEAEAIAGTDTRRPAAVKVMLAAFTKWLDARLGAGGPTDWSRGMLAARTAADGRGQLELGNASLEDATTFLKAASYTAHSVLERINDLGSTEFVRIVDIVLGQNGRYRLWSDGLRECWGATVVPAGQTAGIEIPIGAAEYLIPVGQPIWTGAAPPKVYITALNGPPFLGFFVRNDETVPVTFYWHTRGR